MRRTDPRRKVARALGIGLALTGCRTGEDGEPPADRGAALLAADPVGHTLGPTVLTLGDALSVWHVNALGAGVPGADLTVSIDGSPVSIPTDPSGRGEWRPSAAGSYVVAQSDGTTATVVVHEAPWGMGQLDPAHGFDGATTLATASVGGLALFALSDGRVVQVDPDRGPSTVVQLDSAVRTLEAVALDDDGLRDDLLVVTEDQALLLQAVDGRLMWFAGVESTGLATRGAAVGDVDGDGEPDLAVVSELVLDWWSLATGTPEWLNRHVLPGQGYDVGMTAGPGNDVLTVLLEAGWVRLQEAGGNLLDVGPDAPDQFEGSRLQAAGADMDGDGVEEIVLQPRGGRDPLGNVFIGSLGEGGDQTITEREYPQGGTTVVDADGDGADDVVAVLGDGTVKRLGFPASGAREWTLGRVLGGSVAVHGSQPDTLARLMVATDDRVRVFRSEANSTSPWRPQDRNRLVVGGVAPVRLLAFDDGLEDTATFAAVVARSDDPVRFGTYRYDPDPVDGGVEALGGTVLEEGEDWIDVALCGTQALFLTDTRLLRLDLSGGQHVVEATRRDVDATAIACGFDGTTFVGALTTTAGTFTVDGDLADLDLDAAPGGRAVAIGPPVDDDADPPVQTCADVGCDVTWLGHLDGGPTFVGWQDGALSIGPQGGAPLATFDGPLHSHAVVDLDGDGDLDVIGAEADGTIHGFRAAAGAAISHEIRHRHAYIEWSGPIIAADLDGDGSAEPLGITDAGTLFLWIARGE